MAGYRETFGGNVDYAYSSGMNDMARNLQRNISVLANAGKEFNKIREKSNEAKSDLRKLSSSIQNLKQQISATTDPIEFVRLVEKLEVTREKFILLRKEVKQMPFDNLEKGISKITKGLIAMNASMLSMGFDFLKDSIKRVYELQERWTKAIGGFNLRIGGMTKGLKSAQQAATQWSSTVRGLTDGDINEGIQMFADFTDSISRVVEKGDKFQTFGIQLARGFNVGGQGAGQLSKVFGNIGMSVDEASSTMKNLVKSANAAHVPTNLLAKDILDSSVYMARFGKEGQKTFVTGAAWARKYTIAMEQLKQSVEGLDMFDEAAQTASKLNTTFGTMINSMDLMMQDDPAQRLEMIRQQFLAQGMTFDKLTPKQRRYLTETLKLTDDQTAALLSVKNANESYADFQEKAAKKEKNELTAKQMMEKQLRATAQTMYAFGMAFDRVTVAIANAIKPILKVFGLASDGDKKFKSFGQVMESITVTVERFFNSLAKNEKWNSWVTELAKDIVKAGSALKDFVFSGRAADMVGDIAKTMKSFYITIRDIAVKAAPAFEPLLKVFLTLSNHIKELAVAWAGIKMFNMAGLSKFIPDKFYNGKMQKSLTNSKFAKGGLGALAAGGIGAAVGGVGAGIGSGLGALAGGMIPIPVLGPIIGSLVGGLIGKGIQYLFSSSKKDEIEKKQDDLLKTISSESKTRAVYESQVSAAAARQDAEITVRKARNNLLLQLDKQVNDSKVKVITLTKEEASVISSRANELALFTKSTKMTRSMIENLGDGSKLTKDQLSELVKSSKLYEDAMIKLRESSEQYLKLEQAKLESSQLGSQKAALETIIKQNIEMNKAEKAIIDSVGNANAVMLKYFNGSYISAGKGLVHRGPITNEKDYVKLKGKIPEKEWKIIENTMSIRKREAENIDLQKKLTMMQTDFVRQQSIIQLRAIEMGSSRFLEYSKMNPTKSQAEAFASYISENEANLSSLYGASGYDLLKSTPNFSMQKAEATIMPKPATELINSGNNVSSVRSTNYARENIKNNSSKVNVVSSVADIHIDGQKVGKAIVSSVVTSR